MTTALQKRTEKAIREWCLKNKIKLLGSPRHVHPRCYVVGTAAAQCLIVSRPWVDSEPQCMEENRKHTHDVIHDFDKSLRAGDWCSTAYVWSAGHGRTIAIPVVK